MKPSLPQKGPIALKALEMGCWPGGMDRGGSKRSETPSRQGTLMESRQQEATPWTFV